MVNISGVDYRGPVLDLISHHLLNSEVLACGIQFKTANPAVWSQYYGIGFKRFSVQIP